MPRLSLTETKHECMRIIFPPIFKSRSQQKRSSLNSLNLQRQLVFWGSSRGHWAQPERQSQTQSVSPRVGLEQHPFCWLAVEGASEFLSLPRNPERALLGSKPERLALSHLCPLMLEHCGETHASPSLQASDLHFLPHPPAPRWAACLREHGLHCFCGQ